MARTAIVQPRCFFGDERVARFIQAAPSRATEHLQQLIRLHLLLEISRHVTRVRDDDGAHGKIDPRRQPHRGDDGAKLAVFRERLDQARALRVAQAAVVKRAPHAQQPRQRGTGELLLPVRERKRIVARQPGGDFAREIFRGFSARCEEQHRPELRVQRIHHEPRPPPANPLPATVREVFQIHLLQRHGAFAVRHEHRIASDAAQPVHDILRISDAAAEEQQLRFRRREREREFVVRATHGVRDHLIFIDDEQLRPVALQQFSFLRFKCGHEHLRIEPQREVAGGDANVPPARAPLGELVIRERARRHGKDGLAAQFRHEQLEDERLPRPRRSMDHDVAPLPQSAHGILLPKIGDD